MVLWQGDAVAVSDSGDGWMTCGSHDSNLTN